MKQSIILISAFVVFNCSRTFGQNDNQKSLIFYNEGINMFNQGHYKEADSLFSLSIKLKANPNAYYKLAISKYYLNDTCEFCKNLKKASELDDFDAGKMYESKCLVKRKIGFDNKMNPDSVFYAFFYKDICTNKIVKRIYCIKNQAEDFTSIYKEYENDTLFMNSRNFPGKFPDFYRFSIYKPENKVEYPIFTVVEIMPSYPGGDDARIKFISDNMKYPQMAKEKGIQGTVYVTFVVEIDGSVSDVMVLRGIGGGCDEEAVRIVQLMNKWNPGIQSGKDVRVQYNMPVRFKLN